MSERQQKLAHYGKDVAASVGMLLHRVLGDRSRGRFGILMYHRVAEPLPGLPNPTWNVPPRRFREQLESLLERGYQVWPLRHLLDECASGRSIPGKVTAITFDDGYENNYSAAWPVLRELGVPATIFVASAYLGSGEPLPFDGWAARAAGGAPPAAWRPLTWAQCREMERSGLIEIGSHTDTHRDFRGREELLREDLSRSLERLEAELGRRSYTFSFPYGARALGYASDSMLNIAGACGVACALTTDTDLIAPGRSPFGWGRFEVTELDTGATIAAKLEGWYSWMGPVREIYRAVRRTGAHQRRR